MEYQYLDLPSRKSEATQIPLDITAELNTLAGDGWEPFAMIESRVAGKVGFLLRRS